MNKNMMKKNVNTHVLLVPPACRLDHNGLESKTTVDDDWWRVESVDDDGVKISDPRTGHFRMICDREPRSAWTRADFDLVKGDISKSDAAWQACLRLYDTLMGVAREAWQNESFPPACGFRGLSNVLASVYEARAKTQAKTKKESRPGNLLDCLNVAGLDERIARNCRGILGINLPRARLMLEAYELLLRFAERHQLISTGNAAATQSELVRLHGVLYA
jgi:hypothetical protein